MNDRPPDLEKNRFSARALRYGRVGANVGTVAARIVARRFFGLDPERDRDAAALAAALGGLKGPIMKVAQLLATIPEAQRAAGNSQGRPSGRAPAREQQVLGAASSRSKQSKPHGGVTTT